MRLQCYPAMKHQKMITVNQKNDLLVKLLNDFYLLRFYYFFIAYRTEIFNKSSIPRINFSKQFLVVVCKTGKMIRDIISFKGIDKKNGMNLFIPQVFHRVAIIDSLLRHGFVM